MTQNLILRAAASIRETYRGDHSNETVAADMLDYDALVMVGGRVELSRLRTLPRVQAIQEILHALR